MAKSGGSAGRVIRTLAGLENSPVERAANTNRDTWGWFAKSIGAYYSFMKRSK